MKFYGQWSPPVDKVLFENYFKTKKNGVFIEAGGYDGVTFSCCKFFEDFMGWSGFNFEPSAAHFRKLSRNRPKSVNINAGLGDVSGTFTFSNVNSQTKGAGNDSFKLSKDHLKELKNYGVTLTETKADVITYGEFIKNHNVKNVDLMCLDVEGFEINALDGMKGSKVMPSVMCIEYSYIGLEFIIDYMKGMGYLFNFISFNNAYFSKKSMKGSKIFGETTRECSVKDGKVRWTEIDVESLK